MKTLATLHQKKNGEITICDIPIENAKEIRKIVGYLPQDFSMYPSMNVACVMNYLGILSGLNTAQRTQRIESLLKKVNLSQHKNKRTIWRNETTTWHCTGIAK